MPRRQHRPPSVHHEEGPARQILHRRKGKPRGAGHPDIVVPRTEIIIDARFVIVVVSDRVIASRNHLVGVEGLAVVDTGDALLVSKLDQSATVRGVVAELKARGREDVT